MADALRVLDVAVNGLVDGGEPLRRLQIPGVEQLILGENDIWMMASNRRKPMTIAYTAETPISIEIDPVRDSADFEMALNLTIAIDAVATFASKIAHFTI